MIIGMLSRLARVRITLGYALVLTAVSAALLALGPRVRQHVVALASTNLHNLAHGHLGTLLGSAFVTDAGPIWFWLPGFVCLLALAELIWRSGRLALVFVTGHVGATLLVAAGLTAAIELRYLPLSIARASDVGVSYGAVAVVGALTAAIPRRWKPAWLGWLVPLGITAAVLSEDFTDVGHSIALALGLLASTRLAGPAHWTPVRCGLLAVGGSFGFFIVAHGEWLTLLAGAIGLLGAAITMTIARARTARRPAPQAGLPAVEPALNG
jgi:hypothetical protein